MAKPSGTIIQRIALDGGEEVKKELESLGRVGEVVFKKLERLSKQEIVPSTFAVRLAALKKAFTDVGTAAAATGPGFRQLGTGLSGLRSGIDTVVTRIGLISTAVTGAVVGLAALTKAAADSGDGMIENAQKAGLTVEQFQRLGFVAKTAGVAPEALAKAFNHLNKELNTNGDILKKLTGGLTPVKDAATRIKEGVDGLKDAFEGTGVKVTRFGKALDETKDKSLNVATALKRLGTSAAELKTLDQEGKLLKLADGFAAIDDDAEKAALATAAFGRGGLELLPFLNMGSAGIKKVNDRLKELGLELNAAEITRLGDLADEMDILGFAGTQLRNQLVSLFAPSLIAGSQQFLTFLAQNRQAILDFAGVVRDQAVQAVKDLFAIFEGREQDVKTQWVLNLTNSLKAIGSFITEDLIPTFKGLFAILGQAATALNSVFNTNLSAEGLAIILVLAQLTGAFGLVVPAVNAVIGVFRILIPLLAAGPWGFVAIAAVGAAALIIAHWTELSTFFTKLWEDIRTVGTEAFRLFVADVKAAFGDLGSTIAGIFTSAFDVIRSALRSLAADIQSVIQSLKDAVAAGGSVNFGGTGGTEEGGMGFASGGRVRGRGTGTSDSIRAWLSNGEFVVNAKAVRRYGAEFFSALNAMRLNPPKYAMGGLVQAPTFKMGMPAFAGGGLAQTSSAMHPINLHIDGRTVPVQGSANAAAQLMAIAQRRSLASGGRKPSR